MVDKDRWQQFFEQAKEALGVSHTDDSALSDTTFDMLGARADELYADYEASLVDEAYERLRDR